jgi:phage-related protein
MPRRRWRDYRTAAGRRPVREFLSGLTDSDAFRVLFAAEGQAKHVLLALEGISKKTQKTPPGVIQVAERRLADWRRRGEA